MNTKRRAGAWRCKFSIMKTWLSLLKNDLLYSAGLVLLLAASVFFILPIETEIAPNFLSTKFLVIYVSFISYFIGVLVENNQTTGKLFKFYSMPHNLVLLLLANLSAYALNQNISVFEESVTWLTVFLVVLNVVMAVTGLRMKFEPDLWNYFVVAMLSAGVLLQFYQTLYVLPVMGYGLLGFWFFGLGLHAFVPLWFLIFLLKMLGRFIKNSPSYRNSIVAGATIPLALLIGFVVSWNLVSYEIGKVHHEAVAQLEKEGLPAWAKLGQRIREGWMTKRILNSVEGFSFDFDGSQSILMTDDGPRHDPLIAVASIFSLEKNLPETQLQSLRNSMATARHTTEPRLWSGDKLRTKDIVTNVQLFPAHRLAYTEKTFTIENTGSPRPQEAIFSFYLPEGSVVTSASLWINGKEEPAYLTTKNKAETAYQTIVGRERRDPLLVTWHEGNRVTARIFPCTSKEVRQFKIGVTSPLRFDKGLLFYENIDFDGPEKYAARETIQILQEGEKTKLKSGLALRPKGDYLQNSGRYRNDWSLNMEAPPLSQEAFTFSGSSYQLVPLPDILEPFASREIYLDLNDGWSKKQFDQIWEQVKNRPVFAWSGGMIRLTEENRREVFNDLQALNYSLFPFHKIGQPEGTLVITQSSGLTPLPSDLEGSEFVKQLADFFGRNPPVKVLNMGTQIPPFVQSLKEVRAVQVHSASMEEVLQLIEKQQFPANQEDAANVVLSLAGMKIRQLNAAPASNGTAPDHLLRLFAYNDLMKSVGENYFNKDYLQESLIGQANVAYIVTPVSSLVTLETQEDYDRFDIQKPSENSLKNASIKLSGAVPEPHEWLLILFALTVALWLFGRDRWF
jgi:XrtN system VIT domain protein